MQFPASLIMTNPPAQVPEEKSFTAGYVGKENTGGLVVMLDMLLSCPFSAL
jgi:hypothetical protein